jgi:hypothetical protein
MTDAASVPRAAGQFLHLMALQVTLIGNLIPLVGVSIGIGTPSSC